MGKQRKMMSALGQGHTRGKEEDAHFVIVAVVVCITTSLFEGCSIRMERRG